MPPPQPTKREPDAYWDKFADALKAEFAESHDNNDEKKTFMAGGFYM